MRVTSIHTGKSDDGNFGRGGELGGGGTIFPFYLNSDRWKRNLSEISQEIIGIRLQLSEVDKE